VGIVMLDGNQAHVLKVKNFLYNIVCLINMIIDGGEHE
jgi:hypothetical protein